MLLFMSPCTWCSDHAEVAMFESDKIEDVRLVCSHEINSIVMEILI